MERDGIDKMLDTTMRLIDLGFRAAKESGASISPFIGASVQRPSEPETDDQDSWDCRRKSVSDSRRGGQQLGG